MATIGDSGPRGLVRGLFNLALSPGLSCAGETAFAVPELATGNMPTGANAGSRPSEKHVELIHWQRVAPGRARPANHIARRDYVFNAPAAVRAVSHHARPITGLLDK